MRSPGINGEGELVGQPANPGSPGKMAIETECVCVCVCVWTLRPHAGRFGQSLKPHSNCQVSGARKKRYTVDPF